MLSAVPSYLVPFRPSRPTRPFRHALLRHHISHEDLNLLISYLAQMFPWVGSCAS